MIGGTNQLIDILKWIDKIVIGSLFQKEKLNSVKYESEFKFQSEEGKISYDCRLKTNITI